MAAVELTPVERVDITTLVDNSADALLPDQGLVRRWGLSGTAGPLPIVPNGVSLEGTALDFLRAEHGYSAMVEVRASGRARRLLFDAGVTTDGLIGNLDRLGIEPDSFEAIVLSHGHFDHVMGLHGLVGRIGSRNLPVILHPELWTRRRIVSPGRVIELPTPSRSAIEGAGFVVVEGRQPSFLLDNMLLVTGEIARTTEFEVGMPPGHQAWRDGAWLHDPLVHDDQAVVLHVRDKGLVVLSGCGHAGIVNTVRYAKALTGVEQVYAVIGGLHLRDGPVVAASVSALAAEQPGVVVGAHCTSWLAHHALIDAMPQAYRPNAVGSRFELC